MKKHDIRECPIKEIGTLVNFCNFYPIRRGEKTTDGDAPPHPKDWFRVKTIEDWKRLSIGAELFVKYDGTVIDGWEKGYYLVNKR
jgi:hypothetical protein